MLAIALSVGLRLANLMEMQTQSQRISTSTDGYVRLTSLLFTAIPEQKDAGCGLNMKGTGQLVIESCRFVQMRTQLTGGAIYSSKERVTISDCTFKKCWTQGSGGAVHLVACNVVIEDSQFIDTSSNSIGGAVAIQSASAREAKSVVLERNTFDTCAGGKTGEHGGVVYTRYISQESWFINNTFTKCRVNEADCGCVWNSMTSGEAAITGNVFSNCDSYGLQFFQFDCPNAKSCRFESCVFSEMSGSVGCLTTTLRTILDGCRFEHCSGETGVVVLPTITGTDPHQVQNCHFTDNKCAQVSQSLTVNCDANAPVVACSNCVFSDHTGTLPMVAIVGTTPNLPVTIKDCVFQDGSVGAQGVFTYNAGSGLHKFEECHFRNIVSLAESHHILQLTGSSNVELDGCTFDNSQVYGYMINLGSGKCKISGTNFINCETVYGIFMADKIDLLSLTGCTISRFTVFSALGVLNVTTGVLVLTGCQIVDCGNRLRGGPLVHIGSATLTFTNTSLFYKPSSRASAIKILSGGSAVFNYCAFELEDETLEKVEGPLIEYTGAQVSHLTLDGCCFTHTGETIVTSGSAAYVSVTGSSGTVHLTACCFDLDKDTSISTTIQPTYGEPGEEHMFIECDAWCKEMEPEIPTPTSDSGQEPGDRTYEPTPDISSGDPDSGKATAKNSLGGIIAGILIAILILILVILLLFFMVWRKRRHQKDEAPENQEMSEETVATSLSNDNPDEFYDQQDNPLFAQDVTEQEFIEHFEEVMPWNK